MEKKPQDNIENIYLQQKLLEAAAELGYEIPGQEELNTLLYATKECMIPVCKTVITEYRKKGGN